MSRCLALGVALVVMGCGEPGDEPVLEPLAGERVISASRGPATLADRGACFELALEDTDEASWTLRSTTTLEPEEIAGRYVSASWDERTIRFNLEDARWLRGDHQGRYLVKGYELRAKAGDRRLLGRALIVVGSPVSYLAEQGDEAHRGLDQLTAAVLYLGTEPADTERCRRVENLDDMLPGRCAWIDSDQSTRCFR